MTAISSQLDQDLGIFSAITPLIGNLIVSKLGYQANFGITFIIAVISLILLYWTVTQPRHRTPILVGDKI
jgi:predicted MFS family arabinose efflux permease